VNYKKRYKKLIDEIVRKSFPELKEYNIIPIEVSKFFPFGSFAQRGFGKFFIIMNKYHYRELNNDALRGNFAHELCHIVLDHRHYSGIGDLFHNFRKFLSFAFNTRFSRDIERKVDRETVKRGYAKYLLASHKAWEIFLSPKNITNLHSRGYLTPKEIKSYGKR
jgi:hypothetical protein